MPGPQPRYTAASCRWKIFIAISLILNVFLIGIGIGVLVTGVRVGPVQVQPRRPSNIWLAADALVEGVHADLSLNYTAVALVIDLLARIDVLENRRWVNHSGKETPSWR